jgi:hypothetical protein
LNKREKKTFKNNDESKVVEFTFAVLIKDAISNEDLFLLNVNLFSTFVFRSKKRFEIR